MQILIPAGSAELKQPRVWSLKNLPSLRRHSAFSSTLVGVIFLSVITRFTPAVSSKEAWPVAPNALPVHPSMPFPHSLQVQHETIIAIRNLKCCLNQIKPTKIYSLAPPQKLNFKHTNSSLIIIWEQCEKQEMVVSSKSLTFHYLIPSHWLVNRKSIRVPVEAMGCWWQVDFAHLSIQSNLATIWIEF